MAGFEYARLGEGWLFDGVRGRGHPTPLVAAEFFTAAREIPGIRFRSYL
jgi:hypothetical protein